MFEVATISIFLSLTATVFLAGSRFLVSKNDETIPKQRLFPQPIFGGLTIPLSKVIPTTKTKLEKLRNDMLAAGRYGKYNVENFLAIRNVCILSMFVLAATLLVLEFLDGFELVAGIVVLVAGALAISIPSLILASQAKNRKSKIEKAIPDAMDLIAMAVAGGMPITNAILRVQGELETTFPELSQELSILCRQSKTGSMELAFENFSNRIQIPEVVAWSSLIKQSHRLGGGIANAMSEYANRIREDRAHRIERSGNTASIKLLLPVVTCICPPIAIMLIGPALLDLRDFVKREADSPSSAVRQFNEIRDQVKNFDLER